MTSSKTPANARAIVDDVFGRDETREIWSGNYSKVLPLTVQDFELTGILPAVFYMFRFGVRRGRGKFLKTFGGDASTPKERKRAATVGRVAEELSKQSSFEGFGGDAEQAILGDLLLSFCLENAQHALGRDKQVQRVAPAHYMSCWLDLPETVANLRYAPEMIVAMLADQKGEIVQLNEPGDRTWFAVGRGFEDNVLLRAFSAGVTRRGELGSLTADRFDEHTFVGLDQLLSIRLANSLGSAPDKLRGSESEKISNQRPIAERATAEFSEDIRRFVKAYASVIPRHAFVELLESCIAIGLTTIVTSVVELLCEWVQTGAIRPRANQTPAQIFVDCSNGVNKSIRSVSEQSVDDLMRRLERMPVILMCLRLLDRRAATDRKLKNLQIVTRPYATKWLDLLGELLHERRPEAAMMHYFLADKAEALASRLEDDYPEAASALRNEDGEQNIVFRLAETLTALQGRGNTQRSMVDMLDSCLLSNRPNGLANERIATRAMGRGGRKRIDLRSIVLTDPVLDYLVHVTVLKNGSRSGIRPLSLREFLKTLHHRYGLCIDECPPGMSISNELLQANRNILERRLRDLGLLEGVNDAESMKRLKPRFGLSEDQ